ncbi:hypothetical protein FB451DRAFT_1169465 [Mycena latifolia]|nr:hypothetical protein FB451DRAFT_1169465 [Mycena latifolia]
MAVLVKSDLGCQALSSLKIIRRPAVLSMRSGSAATPLITARLLSSRRLCPSTLLVKPWLIVVSTTSIRRRAIFPLLYLLPGLRWSKHLSGIIFGDVSRSNQQMTCLPILQKGNYREGFAVTTRTGQIGVGDKCPGGSGLLSPSLKNTPVGIDLHTASNGSTDRALGQPYLPGRTERPTARNKISSALSTETRPISAGTRGDAITSIFSIRNKTPSAAFYYTVEDCGVVLPAASPLFWILGSHRERQQQRVEGPFGWQISCQRTGDARRTGDELLRARDFISGQEIKGGRVMTSSVPGTILGHPSLICDWRKPRLQAARRSASGHGKRRVRVAAGFNPPAFGDKESHAATGWRTPARRLDDQTKDGLGGIPCYLSSRRQKEESDVPEGNFWSRNCDVGTLDLAKGLGRAGHDGRAKTKFREADYALHALPTDRMIWTPPPPGFRLPSAKGASWESFISRESKFTFEGGTRETKNQYHRLIDAHKAKAWLLVDEYQREIVMID